MCLCFLFKMRTGFGGSRYAMWECNMSTNSIIGDADGVSALINMR